MNTTILIFGAVANVFTWVGQALEVFTKEPAVYFVALALVSGIYGVGRKILPMRKR